MGMRQGAEHLRGTAALLRADSREFTKGGLVKAGLAMYAFPLCDCNTLGYVFYVEIENIHA